MPWITLNTKVVTEIPFSASMRPRRNAVDNLEAAGRGRFHYYASMRPRRNAVDNIQFTSRRGGSNTSFNEATAKCRG